MKFKAAEHLNEIVGLSMLVLMVVALISGQVAVSRAEALSAVDVSGRYETAPQPLKRTVDARLDPIVDVLGLSAGRLEGRAVLKARRPGRVRQGPR